MHLFDILNERAELLNLKVKFSKQVPIYRVSTLAAKLRNAIVIIWWSKNQVITTAHCCTINSKGSYNLFFHGHYLYCICLETKAVLRLQISVYLLKSFCSV